MQAPLRNSTNRRMVVALLAVAFMTVAMAGPAMAHAEHEEQEAVALAELRLATVSFHSIEAVEQAGYQLGYIPPFLLNTCIAHPTDGAMGFHWFNHDKIHDTTVDPNSPEAMVYAPRSDGSLRLAAVEWVVPKILWEAEHGVGAAPPTVLGHEMHILNPALGWYVAHAWVWMHNPSGVFSDWNPRVDCS